MNKDLELVLCIAGIIFVFVGALSLLFWWWEYSAEQQKQEYDIACMDIGYFESFDSEYCQDSNGFMHRVEFDCNSWSGKNCKAKEIRYKVGY